MTAYTILSYLSRYHYIEEREDLVDEYTTLAWSLCTLDEMKKELAIARLHEDEYHSYMIIINDRLEIVHEVDIE